MLEEVGALIAGVTPWHGWTHWTHLVIQSYSSVWCSHACVSNCELNITAKFWGLLRLEKGHRYTCVNSAGLMWFVKWQTVANSVSHTVTNLWLYATGSTSTSIYCLLCYFVCFLMPFKNAVYSFSCVSFACYASVSLSHYSLCHSHSHSHNHTQTHTHTHTQPGWLRMFINFTQLTVLFQD